jgi:hypothetical protein
MYDRGDLDICLTGITDSFVGDGRIVNVRMMWKCEDVYG